VKPRLKSFARVAAPGKIVFVRELGVEFELDDPSGAASALLPLLDGTRTSEELASELGSGVDDVEETIAALDARGLLEDASAEAPPGLDTDRHASNLAFFSTFASLGRSSFEFQQALAGATVLVLGAGGFGSSVLLSLAGLGVGRLRLVDVDRVERRNLSRQLLYREEDVGRAKVDTAVEELRSFNSSIEVEGVERWIRGPADVAGLLDQPPEVHLWANEACVAAGVPLVGGGVLWAQGILYSVDPGRSACRRCFPQESASVVGGERTNRATAPTAALTASLITLEVLRYLTGFAAPVAAGSVWTADAASGRVSRALSVARDPACPVCGAVAAQPAPPVTLRPLSVVEDGGEFIVGSAETGVFVSIPEVGVVALRALQAGQSVEDATATTSDWAGEHVNVAEFVETLRECGFVLDGAAPEDGEHSPVRAARVAAALFSRAAWCLYALLLAACCVVLALHRELWPDYEDVFYLANPTLSVVSFAATGVAITALHEGAHWLAARAAGVGARFSISRRSFLPVFETDLTKLWALPRERRYGPLLAGMAFNSVLLAAALGVRLAFEAGVSIPNGIVRFAAALVFLDVLGLGFQFLVFLRTDLYAVLVVAFGCRDLTRVNQLRLRQALWGLSPAQEAELADAHPTDVRVARWFSPLYLVGVAGLVYAFFVWFLPGTALGLGWLALTLSHSPVSGSAFLQTIPIALIVTLELAVPIAVVLVRRFRSVRA
jgi:molybdopterin/thiamine biosynthesis adenylyltransferase